MITIKQEINIEEFVAWSGAVDTMKTIREHNMESELEQLVIECLGEEMTETELNDFLWFEDEFIFDSLGISDDEDDEDDEEMFEYHVIVSGNKNKKYMIVVRSTNEATAFDMAIDAYITEYGEEELDDDNCENVGCYAI